METIQRLRDRRERGRERGKERERERKRERERERERRHGSRRLGIQKRPHPSTRSAAIFQELHIGGSENLTPLTRLKGQMET